MSKASYQRILVGLMVVIFAFSMLIQPIYAENPENTQTQTNTEQSANATPASSSGGDASAQDAEGTQATPAEGSNSGDAGDSGNNNANADASGTNSGAEAASNAEDSSAPLLGAGAGSGEAESGTEGNEGESEDPSNSAEARIGDTEYETLADAIAAAEDGVETTITILKDITISGTLTIPKGKNITLKDDGKVRTISNEAESAKSPMFRVQAEATLTLDATKDENLILQSPTFTGSSTGSVIYTNGTLNIKNGTINGADFVGTQFASLVYVKNKTATLNMSGGIIQNATFTTNGWYCSAVQINDGALFNMSGGIIRNNTNNYARSGASSGGGVLLMTWNASPSRSTMNMTGGEISGNKGKYGAGVYMTGYTDMTMTGGKISDNSATHSGGGVCVSGIAATSDYTSSFVLDGGTISGNTARYTGGGIYVNTDGVELLSGRIENNTATGRSSNQYSGHGGGVYVSEVPRVLHVKNAVITDNTAAPISGLSGMGGGIWACPTGSIDLIVTDGLAVFDNQATGRDSAGDDIVNVEYGQASVKGTLTLYNRILGGGAVKWYEDGAVKSSIIGYADTSVPRFDPENPGEEMEIVDSPDNYALKAVVSDAAKRRAMSEADLIIQNNNAVQGGGIGINGDLNTNEYPDNPIWNLQVEKKWDGISEEEQTPVEVFLKIGDEVLDSVTLSDDNDWEAVFTDLPNPDSLNTDEVTVVEGKMVTDESGAESFVETKHYTINYEKTVSEEDATIYVTVTNSPGPTVDIPVEKKWIGEEADSIKVNLLADGEKIDTATITAGESWKHVFNDLPKYTDDDEEIVYTVEEEAIEGYMTSIEGNPTDGYIITNTKNPNDDAESPKRDISVKKVWDGEPTESITVHLLADGTKVDTIQMTADMNWEYTFKDLDQNNSDGNEIVYTVEEDAVEGYTTSISGNATDGYVITNTKNPSDDVDDDDDDEDVDDDDEDEDVDDDEDTDTPGKGTPGTGDSTNLGIWAILVLALSGIAVGLVLIRRRRNQ